MNFEAKMRDIKEQELLCGSLSEEETATQTPRSTSDSYNESSLETPRSSSKSGDADDTYDDSYQEDEYYAFLREMAGSFVQEQDDSGSEGGSEDGAGSEDEDEECEPTVRRKLTLELGPSGPDAAADTGLALPLLPPACGQARRGGDSREVAGGLADEACLREESGSRSSPSNRRGSSSREASPSSYDERCRVPPPCRDNRPPVEDDYDVVQAVSEFNARRPGSRLQQRREDLEMYIRDKKWQASRLLGVASSPSVGLELREHYSRVSNELMEEATKLELQLAALVEDTTSIDSTEAGGKLCSSELEASMTRFGLHCGEVCQVACG